MLKKSNKNYNILILSSVLLLASIIRMHGLFNDHPFYFNPDEARLIKWGMNFSYLDSEVSEWGTLPLLLVKVVAGIFNLFDSPTLIELYKVARIMSVIVGVVTIFLVYLLAKRTFGSRVGIYAAVFTTFTVLHIQYSHFFSLDSIFAFSRVIFVFY